MGSRATMHKNQSHSRNAPHLSPRLAMIQLDDMIQVRRRSATTIPAEFTGLRKLRDRPGVRRMFIDNGDP
jgi:hypothetical protein